MSCSGIWCIGSTAWCSKRVASSSVHLQCLPNQPPITNPFLTRQGAVNISSVHRRHRNVVTMLCMPLVPASEQSRSCSSSEQRLGYCNQEYLSGTMFPAQHHGSAFLFQGWSQKLASPHCLIEAWMSARFEDSCLHGTGPHGLRRAYL